MSKGYILYCYLDKHVIFSGVNQFCFWKPASDFFPMTVLYHKKTFGGKMLCLLISFTFTIKFQASFSICTQVSVASSRKRVRFCMFNTYARSTSPHHQEVSIDGLCTRYPQLYISSSMVCAKELMNLSLQIIRAPLHVFIC